MVETITITKKEYEKLKKREEITDNLIEQFKESLEDIKNGRIKEWKKGTFL